MKRSVSVLLLMMASNMVLPQHNMFNILDYGAKNDGTILATKAIQEAIDDCAGKGGGTVYFPAGRYLSGTVFLKSFVTMYLESGAVLEGSRNLNDYPVVISNVRSYTDTYTNKSLIYGEDLEYISITGRGIIDGNGASFLVPDELRRKDLSASYKARPYMIRIINCRNVLVKDISLINSPMWVQHYMACTGVNIYGITVRSRVNNNNDGIDIDGCSNVMISDCNIFSGDDAIVLKSTLDTFCRNVTITNCVVSSDCNAFKLGTESNGGFQNIVLTGCAFYNTRLAGIALEMVDGGSLSNVSVSDVVMNNVSCPVFIRLGNRARPFRDNMAKPGMGKLSGVKISNIQATGIGKTGCSVTGLPGSPAGDISLKDIRLVFKGGGTRELASREIDEFPDKYPEFGMFGTLPAYGFFCRHVTGLKMEGIELSYETPDYRPALWLEDVEDSGISGLKASCEEETGSVIVVSNSGNLIIRDCISDKKKGPLSAVGNGSSGIYFIDNQIISKEIYSADKTVSKSEISVR
jgi:polygalacturonase